VIAISLHLKTFTYVFPKVDFLLTRCFPTMPPKQSKRNKQKKGVGSIGTSVFPSSATMCVRQPSFKLQQGTSGTGALTSNLSGISITNATNVRINPFTLGSRTALMGALFSQWRVKRMIIQYIPDETASGVLDQPQGAITASVSYGNRAFAMGWFKDPSAAPSTADYVLEFGGRDGNTTRGMTVVVPPSGWLWVSTTGSSPSTIDQRMSAHGVLCCLFRTTSTTTATTYGRIDISAEIEYRYPENSSVVGLSELSQMLNRKFSTLLSVKEDSEEKVVSPSSLPSRGLLANKTVGDPTTGSSGWFKY
jgi:hypothetical protein